MVLLMGADGYSETENDEQRPSASRLGFPSGGSPELDRLMERTVLTEDGCLQYTGAVDPAGYGLHQIGRRSMGAHQASLEIAGVDVPDGMVVDHLCSNRACVRPSHLEVVTQAENSARIRGSRRLTESQMADARRRFAAGETLSSIAEDYGLPPSTLYRPLASPDRPVLHALPEAERDRLMAYVRGRSIPAASGDPDSCWLWNGSMYTSGYARMTVRCHGFVASRAVLELSSGAPIPDGFHAGHLCGRRRCVNPDHIRLQTAHENMSEMIVRRKPHLSDHVVERVRNVYASSRIGYAALARRIGPGVNAGWVRSVVTGSTRRTAPGPVLGRDYERLPQSEART